MNRARVKNGSNMNSIKEIAELKILFEENINELMDIFISQRKAEEREKYKDNLLLMHHNLLNAFVHNHDFLANNKRFMRITGFSKDSILKFQQQMIFYAINSTYRALIVNGNDIIH